MTLFQFGRTIHCTCGSRVGLEQRMGPPVTSSHPRFFADAMLGNLARWLRILGFDTAYHPSILDPELVRRSLAEGRHILTRDRGLREEWRVSHCVVLESDDVELQLEEVFRRFGLEDEIRLFTRCALCNSVLESLDWEEARDRVPARVHASHHSFAACPECRRVYWEGSHTQRIRSRIDRILKT
ncbi:MAG: Mut7-C RNAse domain-containing protein [Gemmatimonadota bacterium]